MIPPGSSRFREILRDHLWKVRGSLCIAGLCLVGATLCELLVPWPLKIILDYILLGKPVPPSLSVIEALLHAGPLTALIALSSAIAVIALVGGILSYGRIFATSKLGYELVDVLRRELFSHVQRLSLSFHTRTSSGEILTKLANDTKVLRNTFTDLPLTVSSHVLTFVGMFIIMLVMSWELSLIILATLPPLAVAIVSLNRKIHRTVGHQRKLEGKMTSRFNEVLSSISLIQAFGRESFEADRFETESVHNLQSGIQTSRTSAAVSKIVALVSAIGTAATVFFGAWQVLKARMTPGDLLIFVAYVTALYKPVMNVSKLSARFSQAWISVERVDELLRIQPNIQDHRAAIKADNLRGDILFEHVSFGYQKDNLVIHDVSFQVRQGQKVALVGGSGTGKSTIVSLLLRLYEPESGRISIDGVELSGYQRESLRQEIGIVLQDTLLFTASVAENISYGKPDATLGEIEEAAKLAHAHDFIMSLPEGYETMIGERGGTLSGGQRQRICVARAIIKQPSILILDEPTSAVDPAAAALIRDTVARLQAGKTTLVIAHQFFAMEQFDQIFVFENGRLVEQGTHRQLVARKGHYYALLNHQMGEKREEDAYASNPLRPQPETEGEAETYA